jgi:hypothetical protein
LRRGKRQGLLRDDSGLLRLLRQHDEGWLHLLHDDEWHAGLLLLIDGITAVNRATTQRSPSFAFARLQARISSRGPILENSFLPSSGLRLTSNSRAPQFDKLTERGNTLDMC